MVRAAPGMNTALSAITTLVTDAPRPAIIARARISAGNDIMASMILWTTRSVMPPKYPLTMPIRNPIVTPNSTLNRPTTSEIRVPYTRRL